MDIIYLYSWNHEMNAEYMHLHEREKKKERERLFAYNLNTRGESMMGKI